jgi:hypothetical protein
LEIIFIVADDFAKAGLETTFQIEFNASSHPKDEKKSLENSFSAHWSLDLAVSV